LPRLARGRTCHRGGAGPRAAEKGWRSSGRRGNRDGGLGRRGERVRDGARRGLEQRAGLLELPATGVAPEAVVTYLGTTGREHVLEEATDELHGRQGRAARALCVVVAIAERHLAILDPLQTTVADGDAEDVATQVLEHFAATAGGLTVYDPVFLPDLR